jgi:hypothetical protein
MAVSATNFPGHIRRPNPKLTSRGSGSGSWPILGRYLSGEKTSGFEYTSGSWLKNLEIIKHMEERAKRDRSKNVH